jgi:site-specific recombinase XerD
MQESLGKRIAVVAPGGSLQLPAPQLIQQAGERAQFAWDEFFEGTIRNPYTRRSYMCAIKRFLAWGQSQELELVRLTPGMVGRYFNELPLGLPTKKLHLAAVRAFFDVLVQRHVMILNPAHSVRTERYSVVEGRTPAISVDDSRKLLASICPQTVVDYRDRALLSVLIYTAARAGAIAKLRLGDFAPDSHQFVLRFSEKGGKARSIPVRHDLERCLREYLSAGSLENESRDTPLFRTVGGRLQQLTPRALSGVDICRIVKRRLRAAGLHSAVSPHSFRAMSATDLLTQGVPLDDVQYLLGHADSRTTRLYDRRQRQVTRNIVERISV